MLIDLEAEENKPVRAFLVGKAEPRNQWIGGTLSDGMSGASLDADFAPSVSFAPNANLLADVAGAPNASVFTPTLSELKGLEAYEEFAALVEKVFTEACK